MGLASRISLNFSLSHYTIKVLTTEDGIHSVQIVPVLDLLS